MNSVHPENFQALNFINAAIKRHTVGTNIILEHLNSSVTLDDEREMRWERESKWGKFLTSSKHKPHGTNLRAFK